MVDLRIFHHPSGKNFKPKDNLNRRTGRVACWFLEWSGWYNQAVSQRLLGHYRLFQLYKKDPDHDINFKDMPLEQGYVLQYRSGHIFKYVLSIATSVLYRLGTLGRPYHAVEIEMFNRALINQHADILHKFLHDADTDFKTAFYEAMTALRERLHNNQSGQDKTFSPILLVQLNKAYNTYQNYLTYQKHDTHNTYVQTNVQPTENTKGKEKNVFSKKQVLILFDLLSNLSKLEKIDFASPNKHDTLATLLHALTGKSKESWMEELKDYKTKDLYSFHTQGELNQLISTISNLAEFLRKAGFRTLAKIADNKLRELERHKKE